MSTQPAVFITVPKYVAITPAQARVGATVIGSTALTRIKPAASQTTFSENCDKAVSEVETQAPKGKKRRLDHLTWEEKVQRKKLKNRVAAQTSRDRKKARMEEMENEIHELTEKTEILANKCESLQTINDSLLEKNRKLDMELEQLRQQLQEIEHQQQQHKIVTCAGCESLQNGSAVSKNTDPLQQGSNLKDPQSLQETTVLKLRQQLKKSATVSSLWRVIALCLLYKICSYPTSSSTKERSMMQSLMPKSWKNLPKASLPISQQTWRLVIERAMRLMPKFHAEQSDCLDQWWGPQQSAWNPANIKTTMTAV